MPKPNPTEKQIRRAARFITAEALNRLIEQTLAGGYPVKIRAAYLLIDMLQGMIAKRTARGLESPHMTRRLARAERKVAGWWPRTIQLEKEAL